MGVKSNAGKGAPPFLGGFVNTAMGKHAYSEKGKTSGGSKVTGFGSTSKKANSDYRKKGGRT
jgi:hypothetical protein